MTTKRNERSAAKPHHHLSASPLSAARLPPSAPGLKRLAGFAVLFILFSGAGTYAVYVEFAARTIVFDPRLLDWELLVGVIGLLCIYFAADGLRLHYTLCALGHRLPLPQMFQLVFINIFFSNITPLATGGGFAQIWYLRRKGVPLGTASAATTVRTLLAVAMIFTATPLVVSTMDLFEGNTASARIGPYLVLFTALYLGFFAVVLFRARWLVMPADGLLRALYRHRVLGGERYRRWRFGLRREVLRFSRGFRGYLAGAPRYVVASIACTAIFLVSLFSFPALLLWGLGYSVGYGTVLALLVVTTFVMYFSPTPGASGIAEGVFGHFFAGMVGPEHLVLVILAWRFLTIYLGMAVGVVVTPIELGKAGGGNGSR